MNKMKRLVFLIFIVAVFATSCSKVTGACMRDDYIGSVTGTWTGADCSMLPNSFTIVQGGTDDTELFIQENSANTFRIVLNGLSSTSSSCVFQFRSLDSPPSFFGDSGTITKNSITIEVTNRETDGICKFTGMISN